tara:strand:- start:3399 stop:4001 length:603 start_codon:yes stop_codon:yes gene_type:complete
MQYNKNLIATVPIQVNDTFNDLIGKYLETEQDKYYVKAYAALFDFTCFYAGKQLFGNNELLPEDVAQEFWICVYQNKFEAFNMIVSLRNFIIDKQRKAYALKRGGGNFLDLIATEEERDELLGGDEKDGEYYSQVRDTMDIVEKYIDTLLHKKKQIARLILLDGWTQQEVSERLQVTQGYVSKEIIKIKQDLQELLTNDV